MIPADSLILLLEDDPDQVLLTKRALSKAQVTNPLHVVGNGEQATIYLSSAKNPVPGLLLLDLRVPRIGGLKLLEWIRTKPRLQSMIVVIVTSSIEPEDRRRADELGAIAYLCKPVDSEGILELMQSIPR